MNRLRTIVAILVTVLVGAAGSVHAACQPIETSLSGAQQLRTVNVALRPSKPFVIFDDFNHPTGLALDIWQAVERDLVRQGLISGTSYLKCNSIAEQEAAFTADEADVIISPLTITADRLLRYDFSQQYLSSGLTVARQSSGAIDFEVAFEALRQTVTQPGVMRAILIFLAFNFGVALLIWLALRRSDDVSTRTWIGRFVMYVLEAVTRTAGLKSVGDGFKTVMGKILEIFMAVVGTALSATVFGVLTTAFLGAVGQTDRIAAQGLPNYNVATLAGSTARNFLWEQYEAAVEEGRLESSPLCVPADMGMPEDRCRISPTWEKAVARLSKGDVELVIGDWLALSYLARTPAYAGKVSVQSEIFLNEPYGWGIRQGQPNLKRAIDRALIRLMRSPEWRDMVADWLGDGSLSPD